MRSFLRGTPGLLFLFLGFLSSCMQEHIESPLSSEAPNSIIAFLSNDTKLTFEDQGTNGVKIKWSPLDSFTLYDASGNYAATFTLQAGEEGSTRGIFVSQESLTPGSTYTAVYPAAPNQTGTLEEYVHAMNASTQSGNSNTSHLDDLCFMQAVYTHVGSTGGSLSFGHQYALLTVKLGTPDGYSAQAKGTPTQLIVRNESEAYRLSFSNVDWNNTLTAYLMVKPCQATERTLSFEVKTTKSTLFYQASLPTNKAYLAGKRYTADFTTQKPVEVNWEVLGNSIAQNATNGGSSLANILDEDTTTEWTASLEGTVAPNTWPRIITIDMKGRNSILSLDITRKQDRAFSWSDNSRDIYDFSWIVSDVIPTDGVGDVTYWGDKSVFPNRSTTGEYGTEWFNTDENPIGWQNFLIGHTGRYLSIIMEGSGDRSASNTVQGSRFAEMRIHIDATAFDESAGKNSSVISPSFGDAGDAADTTQPQEPDEGPVLENARYSVSVQQTDGSWKPVSVHGALVSNYSNHSANIANFTGSNRDDMAFARFSHLFNAPVKVRVVRKAGAFSSVQIRPLSYNVSYTKIDNQTIEFSLENATQKVSVEFNGDRQHNLFVFPDLPDTNIPNANDPNVIYYGAGEHTVGRINLTSGKTLYLAPGAIVYGDVRAENATNITIRGRGILCSSKEDHGKDTRSQQMNIVNCTHVTIKDIIMRDSPHWSLRLERCSNVWINNIKQISWILNSDGVDICNSSYVDIRNCFLRNYDDNITCKNFSWCWRNTEEILVEDNIFWADAAHCMLVGPEGGGGTNGNDQRTLQNITFNRNIVLENRETYSIYTGAMAVMAANQGTFKNIKFTNIFVEDINGGRVLSVAYTNYNGYGEVVNNILFENITYTGTRALWPSIAEGRSDAWLNWIYFGNLYFNGTKVTASTTNLLRRNAYMNYEFW